MLQHPSWQPLRRALTRTTPAPASVSANQKRLAHWRPRWPKNHQAPMRQRFPAFEASPLLIDLDSEDCTAVRAFDEARDGVPHNSMKPSKIERKALDTDVNEFNKKSRVRETRFAQVKDNVFSPWRISDFDLLAAVLLGSEKNTPGLDSTPIRKGYNHKSKVFEILSHNGVQHNARSTLPNITQYMLRRQKLAGRSTPGLKDGEAFQDAITSAGKLIEMERILTNTMQTSQGRDLVSTHAAAVVEKLRAFVRNPSKNSAKSYRERNGSLLSFVNNLVINFRNHEMSPPVHFQELAASLASSSGIQLVPADPVEQTITSGQIKPFASRRIPPGAPMPNTIESQPGLRATSAG